MKVNKTRVGLGFVGVFYALNIKRASLKEIVPSFGDVQRIQINNIFN